MNLNVLSNKLYLLFIYICIFGVTLLFSTATRSVFEVNKLFTLKLTIASLSILYAFDRLIGDKSWFYNIKKNRFFNISLAIVWLSNFLSTIFSKNILISFYGSYDRWEGILTYTLYTLLIFFIANKKGLLNSKRIIWTLIIASSLSCLYGIVQSFGIDIVKWSMDPSMRVFGSINNPVHYCAILGMSIPLVIGQLFFTIKENNNPSPKILNFFYILLYYVIFALSLQLFSFNANSIYWILIYVFLLGLPYLYYGYVAIKAPSIQNQLNILFNSTILITYATYLSYSRATWLGLTAALGLMFTITIILENKKTTKTFLLATFGCLFLTIFSYLFILFKLYILNEIIFIVSFILIFISHYLISIGYNVHRSMKSLSLAMILIMSQFFTDSIISTLLIGIFTLFIAFNKQQNKIDTSILLTTFIISLMNVQFFSNSIIEFFNFILLLINLFLMEKTTSIQTPFSKNPILQWKIIIIATIMIVILSPKIYLSIKSMGNSKTTSSSELLIKQASSKISSYSNVAIEGTARTSMWKSSLPWIKDHPVIGSGLDTIKYLYPKYRRAEYGKLEGGHNYTPDRLHNEYLNVLATKGIFGFIVYYIVFIGGNFLLLLLFIHKSNKPNQYLILGLIGSALVYLGQVMFNFGVVATMVYFITFIGLAINLKLNYENN